MKLLSSFTFGALRNLPASLDVVEVSEAEVIRLLTIGTLEPSIGHPSLAKVLSRRLGIRVTAKRETLSFGRGDRLMVAQLFGFTRQAEGKILTAAELESCTLRYLQISIK